MREQMLPRKPLPNPEVQSKPLKDLFPNAKSVEQHTDQ
jgi:hypothetical protein